MKNRDWQNDCCMLWSQSPLGSLGESARCQGAAQTSVIPLIPSASLQKLGTLRNGSGQANKSNADHPDSQTLYLREPPGRVSDCPLNTFSRQFPLAIRAGGLRRMLYWATWWDGKVEGEMQLISPCSEAWWKSGWQ